MTHTSLSLLRLAGAVTAVCVLTPAIAFAQAATAPASESDGTQSGPMVISEPAPDSAPLEATQPVAAESADTESADSVDEPFAVLPIATSEPDEASRTEADSETIDAVEAESAEAESIETAPIDEEVVEQATTRQARRVLRNREALESRPERSGISDAVYNRPFVVGGQRAALGGYMEAGGTWTKEEGVVEGASFSLARFNLFVYARILPRVEFMSEIEFENGGQEIKIETAQLDFALAPWLSLRAGVLLVPIGGFNQDHDAPRWPLVDRPLVSETVLPATLSEVGLGFHGEQSFGDFRLNGQLYVTNGISEGIIGNATGRVDIPSGKSPDILDFNANGRPAVSGRIAGMYGDSLELGVSAYHGAYNQWMMDGEEVDVRRALTLGAIDLRAEFWRIELRGEVAMAWIDLPEHSGPLYASKQFGWHLDVYTDIIRHQLNTGTHARLRWVMRAEQADYYVGNLTPGARAGDQISGLTVGFAWQLDDQLVIRTGVRNRWFRDLLNNPAEREIQVQLGVASYF